MLTTKMMEFLLTHKFEIILGVFVDEEKELHVIVAPYGWTT